MYYLSNSTNYLISGINACYHSCLNHFPQTEVGLALGFLGIVGALGTVGYDLLKKEGRSILHFSALVDSPLLFKICSLFHSNVNIPDNLGETPFHYAVDKNNISLCKYLLTHGANVHATTCVGSTPLHYAKSPEMCELLLHSGANVNQPDHFGQTSLHVTTAHNRTKNFKILLENGANVNAMNSRGETPLHCVKSPEICNLLLQNGANINLPDHQNNTPLHKVAKNGLLEIADMLMGGLVLNDRTNISARNISGQTPLSVAARCGHFNVVNLFTKYKAYEHAATSFNNTRLYTAGI